MNDELERLQREHERRRRRHHQPASLKDILAELISRRGYARVRGQEHLDRAWSAAIGEPGSKYTRVGSFRRGVLEVLVANSVLLQELAGFQRQGLLARLRQEMASDQVRELRFRLDSSL